MRICSFSMVKNEADIIEAFCRHNLRYVDRMYILDNMSEDNTVPIIKALIAEGLPIVLRHDATESHDQGRKTTRHFRRIQRKQEFDLMFLIDADEFIDYPSRDIFIGKPGDVFSIERLHYVAPEVAQLVPHAAVASANVDPVSPFATMPLRMKRPENSKRIIFMEPPGLHHIRIGNGNHNVVLDGVKLPRTFHPHVRLRHFPLRSRDHFVQKNVIGWFGMMLWKPGLQTAPGVIGGHWRAAYRFILERRLQVSDADMLDFLYPPDKRSELAEALVADPFLSDVELRYRDLIAGEALTYLLIKSYERTIDQLWELRGNQVTPLAGDDAEDLD